MSELPPINQKFSIDATDYKTGVIDMNRQIRVLESGFRAAAAGLGDWSKDASGLELRIEALNKEIEIQKDKVEATRQEYERIREEKGDNSRASQELKIKLNRETEALGKMERELKDTRTGLDNLEDESDAAGDEMKELADKTDKAKDATGGFKSVLGGLGGLVGGAAAAVAGLAVVAGVAVGGIAALVKHVTDLSGELVDMSLKTGISTTDLQELDFVAGQVGTSTDDITGSLSRMIRSMGTARDQSEDYADKLAKAKAAGKDVGDIELGPAAQAFEKLGVRTTDIFGNMRDSEKVFYDVIDALGKMSNETERDAVAMEIFGRSAMELNPLIKAGSDEIARLREEAHEMGAVIDEEGVAAAEGFGDKLAALSAGLKGVAGTIGLLFLPAFDGIADMATGALKELVDVIGATENFEAITKTAVKIISELVVALLKQVGGFMEIGFAIILGIIDGIMTYLPGMIPVAINIIQSLVNYLIRELPLIVDSGVKMILALINGILPLLPMLLDVAIQAITTLATGIAAAAPELIPAMMEAVVKMTEGLVANLSPLIDASLVLIQALADGLIASIPVLLDAIPEIMTSLVEALIESEAALIEAGTELIVALSIGIVENIPALLNAIAQADDAILESLKDIDWSQIGIDIVEGIVAGIMPRWVEFTHSWNDNWIDLKESLTQLGKEFKPVGKAIVSGIWSGLTEKWEQLKADISYLFSELPGVAKIVLGIQSPSTVFAGIGGNMVAGLLGGFTDEMGSAERNIAQRMGRMAAGLDGNLTMGLASQAGRGAAQAGQHVTNNNNNNITLYPEINSEVDLYRMARLISEQIRQGR